MAKLQSVGFEEELQAKIKVYATEHGQSFSAATVELASRGLDFQEAFGHLNVSLIKNELDKLKKQEKVAFSLYEKLAKIKAKGETYPGFEDPEWMKAKIENLKAETELTKAKAKRELGIY